MASKGEYTERSPEYKAAQPEPRTQPPFPDLPLPGLVRAPVGKNRLVRQIMAMLREVQGEHREPIGRLHDRDNALAEARELLTAPRKPIEVNAEDREHFMETVLRSIENEPSWLLGQVTAAIIRDPEIAASLRKLTADADKFEEQAREVAKKLEPDSQRHLLIVPFILGALCLIAGGVTIPLLVAGTKAELIYSNVVASTSTVCAAAFIIQDQKKQS